MDDEIHAPNWSESIMAHGDGTQQPTSDRDLLTETHTMVRELKAVIVGLNGDQGLCGDVRQLVGRLNNLEARHNRLSKWVYVMLGILGLAGAGGGIYGGLQ